MKSNLGFRGAHAGHLAALSATDVYRYLAQEHDATTAAVLLGSAAAKRGSLDPAAAKMLFLHVPSRHPAGYPELELSPLVQAAALLGLGLLFQGSCHRCATALLPTAAELSFQLSYRSTMGPVPALHAYYGVPHGESPQTTLCEATACLGRLCSPCTTSAAHACWEASHALLREHPSLCTLHASGHRACAGTCARSMGAEIMLEEIGRQPAAAEATTAGAASGAPPREGGPPALDWEGYSLSAGLALGLITLGRGRAATGLSDLRIEERLRCCCIFFPPLPCLISLNAWLLHMRAAPSSPGARNLYNAWRGVQALVWLFCKQRNMAYGRLRRDIPHAQVWPGQGSVQSACLSGCPGTSS
jgi:hypothetical protein